MLDQILIDYAGYAVGVEWHISSSYPLYNAEGRSKMYSYPPPFNGGYATPWAWIDGRNATYLYNGWAGYISQRMLQPTDVRLNITGTYNPTSRQGTVQAVFYNSGLTTVTGRCQMVVTEDSLYYAGPNGDPWHNHVCRDYLPDHLGTPITIPAGGYDTVIQNFTLQPGWVERMCKVVVYAQDPSVHPDSGYGGIQAGQIAVLGLTGISEPNVPTAFYQNIAAEVAPNPCRDRAVFRFVAPAGQSFRLGIYRPDGTLVEKYEGAGRSGETQFGWRRSAGFPAGVYAWRLECGSAVQTGKLIVND